MSAKQGNSIDKHAEASLANLERIFTLPEGADSTLMRLDREISENLAGFLRERIVAVEKDLAEVEQDFAESRLPEQPRFVAEQVEFLLEKLVAHSVHTAAPSFIGHMTSALPYFMLPLSKIMIALNQNLVKTETSKAFTPLERQVLGMLHGLIYEQDDAFYEQWMHNPDGHLGAFCSGGTVANITALWVARNRVYGPRPGFRGIAREGWLRALRHYGDEGAVVLVSERGHYSLSKAVDVLGMGRDDLIAIPTDGANRIDIAALRQRCQQLKQQNMRIMAIVGVAGATETGSVDDLQALAAVAKEYAAYLHVDAAWGGPTLFSNRYRHLLAGIEQADSVTIDAHKQMYVPMGAGMVLFKDPQAQQAIVHHAQYIIRKGSRDLGSSTLEGSRPGMALLVHSGLHILGRQGYELLVNSGIERAKAFASLIKADSHFELISEPVLNILTYRLCPQALQHWLQGADPEARRQASLLLNRLTRQLQKTQRERGRAFVSRTQLNPERYQRLDTLVFRVVLANPLTTDAILQQILQEQWQLAQESQFAEIWQQLTALSALPLPGP